MLTRGFVRGWAGAGVLAQAVVLTFAVLLALAGCTAPLRVPAEVTALVDDAVAGIRSTPGVATVTARVSSHGGSYGGPANEPVVWFAVFDVQAEGAPGDLRRIAGSVATDIHNGPISSTAVLRLPGEDGGAEVRLEFSPLSSGILGSAEPEDMADAALTLRDLPGVRSVAVLQHGEPATVTVDSPARWASLMPRIRAIPDFGSGALTSVALVTEPDDGESSMLTFDPRSPAAELLPLLGELAQTEGVESVEFDGVDTRKEFSAWRPALRVLVDTRTTIAPVAGQLTRLADSQSQVQAVPRAAFIVSTGSGDSSDIRRGYLGLPIGSGEPDDRMTGLPGTVPPAAVDPAAAAARLELDRALVTTLLDAAGDAAGIRGPASVTTETCVDGENELVQGAVVIPVFEIADSADEAFDAITTEWEVQGYIRSDRAMGRDFWSVPDGSLDTLSIRGTAEGISIMVTAPCVLL